MTFDEWWPKPAAAGHRVAPWPYECLDIAAVRRGGWRPTPFRDVVVKVHQRCNLACDYCYVYELRDRSWRHRPAVMGPAVVRAAARAIADHVARHDLRAIRVILHGGEPLLVGRERLLEIVSDLRNAVPLSCRLKVGLQTNGLLLDEEMLQALADHGIGVGVSLDGPAAVNDRHRRHADGRGSYDTVARALRLLGTDRFRSAFVGVLCTIEPSGDPVACYETLLRFRPPSLDFLLPHANWSSPPPQHSISVTPYGDWMVAVFDRWYGAATKETSVRLFESIISLVCGGPSRSEQVGLSPVGVLVIESDGAIEQVDALKSAYPGARVTGLNVLTDPLDAALGAPRGGGTPDRSAAKVTPMGRGFRTPGGGRVEHPVVGRGRRSGPVS
jgi:uncharacterized protein